MIETQIIKKNDKPIAVILDYDRYLRLKEIEEDKSDYDSAIETKLKNKKWYSHKAVKNELDLE